MPYAENEGIHIHYKTEGEAPPLVLQHWSLATMESWYDYGYVSALKNRLPIDPPGCARTWSQ
jgi:pimeloyl-ACP methyl ester carboxylesterase